MSLSAARIVAPQELHGGVRELGRPPDWHERRRVAARSVIAEHGSPEALASLDACQALVRDGAKRGAT